ncbi:DoxX family membrane protein [Campylobacter iguaniorum]|uniref:DoxX family membrane protein n=1 Tax=Campylobacter iguaniorum TaxID=1244531 RepID=UPI0007C8D529|nr:DoxX family membrane protein [Campylobacter iguaniorum]
MRSFCSLLSLVSSNFQSITLLLIRLILAFGFYETAISKWQNIEPTAEWFASIGVPFPLLSVYLMAILRLWARTFLIKTASFTTKNFQNSKAGTEFCYAVFVKTKDGVSRKPYKQYESHKVRRKKQIYANLFSSLNFLCV